MDQFHDLPEVLRDCQETATACRHSLELAMEAYHIASIKCQGFNTVTNFSMSHYDVKSITTLVSPLARYWGGPSGQPPTTCTPSSPSTWPPAPGPPRTIIGFGRTCKPSTV